MARGCLSDCSSCTGVRSLCLHMFQKRSKQQATLCRTIPLVIVATFVMAALSPLLNVLKPRHLNLDVLSRPPMGWNSWNHYGCNISEQVIRETADAMVDTGLRDAGYEYLNIDDCWQSAERDEQGRLMADPSTFPSGMKALADYVHSRGLKFGVYSDAGHHTCAGRAGSLGHENTDAQSFAEWGVDFLKYDNCFPGVVTYFPFQRYKAMGDALKHTGRKIVFSMCNWGLFFPAWWGKRVAGADLWRTTSDIQNSWDSVLEKATWNNMWAPFAGPGGWNDPDMLEVGNGVLTPGEDRAHFSLWAIMKAPLLLGCDVTSMSNETRDIILNEEAIAVNQDSLGIQGQRISNTDTSELWAGPLSGERVVVALVNKGSEDQDLSLDLPHTLGLHWGGAPYSVRDIWNAQTFVVQGDVLTRTVPAHDVAFLVLKQGVPDP